MHGQKDRYSGDKKNLVIVIPYKKYIDLKDVIYKIILNIHVYAYIYIRLFTWNQEVK